MTEENIKVKEECPPEITEEKTEPPETMTTQSKPERPSRRSGRRGRRPVTIDSKAKLERSRQSARECRARKKLRYQYLEELVSSREKSIHSLRNELETLKQWSIEIDKGNVPPQARRYLGGAVVGSGEQRKTRRSSRDKENGLQRQVSSSSSDDSQVLLQRNSAATGNRTELKDTKTKPKSSLTQQRTDSSIGSHSSMTANPKPVYVSPGDSSNSATLGHRIVIKPRIRYIPEASTEASNVVAEASRPLPVSQATTQDATNGPGLPASFLDIVPDLTFDSEMPDF